MPALLDKAPLKPAPAPGPRAERRSARERLLAAAEELFYEEGINTVGIDRVIERAGVAKASLYDVFGSKDELIRAYLVERKEARQARIARRLESSKTPRNRLLAVFDALADICADPAFRGCAFLRASAEARPGSSLRTVCDDSRRWTHDLFVELARDAGAAKPEQLAHQLVVLYDGAVVAAQMDRDPAAATLARSMAAQLLDAAIGRKSRKR
jgi:AcrR family transcriptional regulator